MACLGKSGVYFSEHDAQQPCSAARTRLENFWIWHPTNDLDVYICDNHAHMAIRENPRSYLAERIRAATEKGDGGRGTRSTVSTEDNL